MTLLDTASVFCFITVDLEGGLRFVRCEELDPKGHGSSCMLAQCIKNLRVLPPTKGYPPRAGGQRIRPLRVRGPRYNHIVVNPSVECERTGTAPPLAPLSVGELAVAFPRVD